MFPVLEFPAWGRQRYTGGRSQRRRDGSLSALKNGQGSCACWAAEGSVGSGQCVWTPKDSVQTGLIQTPFSGAKCQEQRPQAPTETQEVPSEHQEMLFYWGSDTTGCPGRWCSLSLSMEILQSCLDMVLGSWTQAGPASARGGLEKMSSRGPFQPPPVCDSESICWNVY